MAKATRTKNGTAANFGHEADLCWMTDALRSSIVTTIEANLKALRYG